MSPTAEKTAPGIYRIEVPLVGNALKAVNCYVITSGERPLIVDTAMNRPDCLERLRQGFAELGVDPKQSDFFVTHRHGDHHGLITTIASESSRVYIGRPDLDFIRDAGNGGRLIREQAPHYGFPLPMMERAMQNPPASPDSRLITPDYRTVGDGDTISAGSYNFRCITTPGHSPGQVTLYDEKTRLFFSGDHILGTITPNISGWFQTGSPLHDYLASLDKIHPLEVDLVLPGHREPFRNFRTRLDELRQHHLERTEEVVELLRRTQPNHAYDLAQKMRWDISFPTWEDFPTPQKWFASGEALAHLLYLEREGRVRRREIDGVVHFETA